MTTTVQTTPFLVLKKVTTATCHEWYHYSQVLVVSVCLLLARPFLSFLSIILNPKECDSEWHMQCLVPPLLRIPSGKWYCPEVVEMVTQYCSNLASWYWYIDNQYSPFISVFHLKCVRERGRRSQRERVKRLAFPTVSPIHKEKDHGGRKTEKQIYPFRYSVSSVVQLVRDIASREISDKEVQVCGLQCSIYLLILPRYLMLTSTALVVTNRLELH